jgi:cytochrome c biogenesis protein
MNMTLNNLARNLPGRVWRFLSSIRLALVLMLILANLTLIGTLLIQAPPETIVSPGEYAWWLDNVARPRLGLWATPLDFLKLFDVFHSFWFLGTGMLLVISISVCTLDRWKQVRSAVFARRVRQADEFYESGTNRAQFGVVSPPLNTAVSAVAGVLRKRGFRVRVESAADGSYIAADRNRLSRLGTFVSHLSIVLFVLGFLLGSFLGFRDKTFMVPEGSTRDLGHETGLSLYLESFVDEYWPEGPPKDYRSQVTLYEDGREVRSGLIRVNHPMSYKGVRIYQSFFGSAAVMQVRDSAGRVVFQDGVALGWVSGQKPYQRATGSFSLPEAGLTAYVLAPAQGGFDPLLKAGQMYIELYRDTSSVRVNKATLDQGVSSNMEGMEFTFVRERQFSGFQLTRDPGNLLIWISSGLFIAGLVSVLYFTHRQAWVRIHVDPGGWSRVSLRMTSSRGFGTAQEFESLVEEMKRLLVSAESAAGDTGTMERKDG